VAVRVPSLATYVRQTPPELLAVAGIEAALRLPLQPTAKVAAACLNTLQAAIAYGTERGRRSRVLLPVGAAAVFVLTADRLVATNGRAAQVVTRYEEEGSDAEAVEEYAFSSFPAVVMRVVGLVQIHKALQPTRAAQNAPLFGVAVGALRVCGLFAEHDVTGRGPVAH